MKPVDGGSDRPAEQSPLIASAALPAAELLEAADLAEQLDVDAHRRDLGPSAGVCPPRAWLADVDIDPEQDERPNQDGDQKLEDRLEAVKVVEVVLDGRHDDSNDHVERSERNTAHAGAFYPLAKAEKRVSCIGRLLG
jgi:hypothetical protein